MTPDAKQLLSHLDELLRQAALLRDAIDAEAKRAAVALVIRAVVVASTN